MLAIGERDTPLPLFFQTVATYLARCDSRACRLDFHELRRVAGRAPALRADTAEVLEELGLAAADVKPAGQV
jgi:hypothetical protein